MNLYDLTVPHYDKYLANVDRWIDKALAFATAKKFDANTLLQARLAPDMLPLSRQIQIICDHAKFGVARSAGKEAPSHPDTETTWDELRNRIRIVREYVASFKPADFEGAETRLITLPFAPDKRLTGGEYIVALSLPNFAFHLVTAYAILRHNGVDLGKSDYMGSLTFRDP